MAPGMMATTMFDITCLLPRTHLSPIAARIWIELENETFHDGFRDECLSLDSFPIRVGRPASSSKSAVATTTTCIRIPASKT